MSNSRILIVDDDRLTRMVHRRFLASKFDVLTAANGEEAIATCRSQVPDLIVLDVMMDGIDGYETCMKIREFSDCPVIFVTSHSQIEEHLKAYDAGGSAVIVKPVSEDILVRKVELGIQQHRDRIALQGEKGELHSLAMNFLENVGSGSILLNFVRNSIRCHEIHALAKELLKATEAFGQNCIVQFREDTGPYTTTWHGEPSQLELSILEHASSMGRVFQFRNQLAINYEHVTILSTNLPDDRLEPERAGSIRDNLTILAETTDSLLENVEMRQASINQAEQLQIAMGGAESALEDLQGRQRQMLLDVRLLLQELVDKIESGFTWLDTSNEHERQFRQLTDDSIQKIVHLLNNASDLDDQFAPVLEALYAGKRKNSVELF